VIDAEGRKLLRRVKIGGNPYISLSPRRTPPARPRLVERHEQRRGDLLRPEAEKIDGRVEVSTWPAHGIFSRDGKLVYVSGETAGDVTIIAWPRGRPWAVCPRRGDAMGLAVTADGRRSTPPRREQGDLKIDTVANKTIARSRCPASSTRPRSRSMASTSTQLCGRSTDRGSCGPRRQDRRDDPQKGFPDLVTMEPTAAMRSSPTDGPIWSA